MLRIHQGICRMRYKRACPSVCIDMSLRLCSQVLYTMPSSSSSKDDAIVSESGAMNVCFVLDKVMR